MCDFCIVHTYTYSHNSAASEASKISVYLSTQVNNLIMAVKQGVRDGQLSKPDTNQFSFCSEPKMFSLLTRWFTPADLVILFVMFFCYINTTGHSFYAAGDSDYNTGARRQ